MREAARCYIFGLWHSSVAMARAALEQGLRGILKSKDNLAPLIQAATRLRLWSTKIEGMARFVQTVGNGVLHDGPATPQEALDTLRNARAVLIHLYTNVPS